MITVLNNCVLLGENLSINDQYNMSTSQSNSSPSSSNSVATYSNYGSFADQLPASSQFQILPSQGENIIQVNFNWHIYIQAQIAHVLF